MNAEFIALDHWHNAGMRYALDGRTKINSLESRTFRDCPDLKWAFWLGYGAATYRDYAEGQAVAVNQAQEA